MLLMPLIIKDPISCKTVNSSSKISEVLNKHLTSTGPTLAKNIKPTSKGFTDYLT